MAQKAVRVRFAPSPTGNLHIGGLRTALFNWLFARHNAGTFLVRIEDTDKERSEKKYVTALLDALAWVGLESDEEIIFQSERQHIYKQVVDKLIAEKKAYRCICTPEEIEARVRAVGNLEEHYGYDGFCKDRKISDQQGKSFGIRFVIPQDIEKVIVNDEIRGEVVFERNQLDDFVIFRSDGTPMYNFAVVVDDYHSGITHVIRGEEHLPNTPKQMLLYSACQYELPRFAHIPMILAPDGSKLSKRYGAVDIMSYRDQGFLPDALVNYIVRLGWAHGDQELFNRSEMIASFTLEGVGKKAAIFDIQKLEWMNGVYMREASPAEILRLLSYIPTPIDSFEKNDQLTVAQKTEVISLYQSRVKNLIDLAGQATVFFAGPTTYNLEDVQKWTNSLTTPSLLGRALQVLELQSAFEHHEVGAALKGLCDIEGIKLGNLAQPLRIALTGGASSPGVFEMLALLGKEKSIARIKTFKEFLER